MILGLPAAECDKRVARLMFMPIRADLLQVLVTNAE